VVKELLEDLVARGVNPDQKRLFVIDGSKALRTAINAVFGEPASGAALPRPQTAQRDGPVDGELQNWPKATWGNVE
jgi:hypothetical protein